MKLDLVKKVSIPYTLRIHGYIKYCSSSIPRILKSLVILSDATGKRSVVEHKNRKPRELEKSDISWGDQPIMYNLWCTTYYLQVFQHFLNHRIKNKRAPVFNQKLLSFLNTATKVERFQKSGNMFPSGTYWRVQLIIHKSSRYQFFTTTNGTQ